MSENSKDYISLKWGTLKSWRLTTPKLKQLMEEYHSEGASLSAMTQQDTPRQKKIICEMIDIIGEPVYNAWSGEYMNIQEAKAYVMNYEQ